MLGGMDEQHKIVRPAPHQPLPPEAKKVFEGVIYDIYHWPRQLFDGRVVTYEKLARHDSVVIVPVTAEGTIVVQREQQPGTQWYAAIPAGGIDEGEEPLAAAVRELREETGYEAAQMDFWFAHQVEHRADWAIFVFIAKGCVKKYEQAPGGGERVETREVSFEEFLRLVTEDDFQNINIAPKLLKAALDPEAMAALKQRFGVVN